MKAVSVILPVLALVAMVAWLVLRDRTVTMPLAVTVSQDCVTQTIDRALPAAGVTAADAQIITVFATATACLTRDAMSDCFTFGMTPTDGSCTDQALARLTQAETDAMTGFDALPERLRGIVARSFARMAEAGGTCGGRFDRFAAGQASAEVLCAGFATASRIAMLQVAGQMAQARRWTS